MRPTPSRLLAAALAILACATGSGPVRAARLSRASDLPGQAGDWSGARWISLGLRLLSPPFLR